MLSKDQAYYFFKEFSKNLSIPNHRYLSWEYCYRFFMNQRTLSSPNSPNFDLLSLHLAFYLASWGMYRGSSELLQKNYHVHLGAIKEILWRKDYDSLWGKIWSDKESDEKDLNFLFDENGLIDKLCQYYHNLGVSPTITLISKIIMGTMGCLPAYDRFLITGIRADGISFSQKQNKGKNSSNGLIIENIKLWRKSFENLVESYGTTNNFALPNYTSKTTSINYPQMKIIDCIFWQFGFFIEEIKYWFKKHPNDSPLEIIKSSPNGLPQGSIPKLNKTLLQKDKKTIIEYPFENEKVEVANLVLEGWQIKDKKNITDYAEEFWK